MFTARRSRSKLPGIYRAYLWENGVDPYKRFTGITEFVTTRLDPVSSDFHPGVSVSGSGVSATEFGEERFAADAWLGRFFESEATCRDWTSRDTADQGSYVFAGTPQRVELSGCVTDQPSGCGVQRALMCLGTDFVNP